MSAHTPGPWEMWTSCSFRRIGSASGKLVVEPITQRSDGCPDLYFRNGGYEGPDARLILAAPDLLALLIELIDIEGPCPGNAAWAQKVREALRRAGAV